MATTYTSPMGLTQPAQGADNLASSIQSITGSFPGMAMQASQQAAQMQANEPMVKAQEMLGLSNKFQIPQSTDYAAKIVDMYMHDKNLNQQFQGNPAGSPITTMPGTDVVSAVPRLTPENLNQPFSGFTDPVMASQAGLKSMTGAMDTLKNVSDLIGANMGKFGKQFDVDMSAYESNIKAQSALADQYLKVYDSLKQTGLSEKDLLGLKLDAAKSGFKLNKDTGEFEPLTPGASLDKATDRATLRTQYQELYNSAATMDQRSKIADDFKKSTGRTLFPEGIKDASTLKQLSSTIDTVKLIKEAQDILNRRPDLPLGLVRGTLTEQIYKSGMFRGLINDPDVEQFASIVTKLRAAGDRTLIGGRLTGYLLDKLNPAFPSLETNADMNKVQLAQALDMGLQDLQTLADSKEMEVSDLPGYETLNKRLSQSGDQSPTGGAVRLLGTDGKTYEYDGTSDPDYISDLKAGFRPL